MISANKSRSRCLVLALLFAIASVEEVLAKNAVPAESPAESAVQTDLSTQTAVLAAQVGEIANSVAISRAKKEKRISTAVRVAVAAATAYKKDPTEILGIALELTEMAARAAPPFAEVIANAASFSPAVARIDAAPGQIRAAAYAAAKVPRAARKVNVASSKQPKPKPARRRTEDEEENSAVKRVTRPARTEENEPEPQTADYVADSMMPSPPAAAMAPRITVGKNAYLSLTAELSARHDDNVFLTNTDTVSDTIISLTPGIEFHFGQNSLAHGSMAYKDAFTRYASKSAPNVTLGTGSADFGYDNGSLKAAGSASFQQLYQNNSDVAALAQKTIFRRDVLNIAASAESQLTGKTSVKAGADFNRTEYKTAGLIGSQDLGWPLKFYFETTPKVSLSTGLTYRSVKAQNGGPSGRDMDYNIGARGNFTPKLTGEFSVGYQTREVGDNPKENLWGFNGSFRYDFTPKTDATLVMARNFSAGALGDSLKSSTYSFRLSTEPTPQWQFGTGISYRDVGYGPAVFSLNNTTVTTDRKDGYWEGNLQATYFYTNSLSATADYTLRDNHSTVPGVRFSNNLLSLILGWRY